MYYSTFQPYIDDKQDKCIVEEKICMICWDGSGNLISLQCIKTYSKTCNCDGDFHHLAISRLCQRTS